MVSKTKINQRMKIKTNSYLAEAIFLAKKKNLLELAEAISVPTRRQAKVSLDKINRLDNKSIIIPGKVLGQGNLDKKFQIYALGFSNSAKEKLKKAGCEFKLISESLKKGEKITGEIIR